MKAALCAASMMALAMVLAPPVEAHAEPGKTAAADAEAFTGDPALSHVQLSPSGRYLAFVRSDGVRDQLVVLDLIDKNAKPLMTTRVADAELAKLGERQRLVYVHWKSEERLVVSLEVPNLRFGVGPDVDTADAHFVVMRDGSGTLPLNVAKLNRDPSVMPSSILDILPRDPQHVLVNYVPGGVDRVDITNGSKVHLEDGGRLVLDYGTDRQGVIITRLILVDNWTSPAIIQQVRAPGTTAWTRLWEFHEKDFRAMQDIELLAYAEDSGQAFVRYRPNTAADGDTYTIRKYDLINKALGPVVWSHPRFDAESVIIDEETGKFLGACYIDDVEICDFSDPALAMRFRAIAKFFEGRANITLISQTEDNKKWVLRVTSPEEPGSYYVFDVAASRLEPIGAAWPKMQAVAVGVVKRFDYKARDGHPLFAYVTTPPGPGPHPLVVMPHGGPETRDSLGFDTWAQFLAKRGYVVLQPNFRGSSGFGRAFAEAGYGQWGGLMQDDVTDGVRALAAGGQIDPKRVCIVGASYGGYVALYAAATQGDLYKCAVSVDGVTDLPDMIAQDQKAYGADSDVHTYELKAMGDPRRDGERLRATSPTHLAAKMNMPILLIQGGSDRIVPVQQAHKMNQALLVQKREVHYVEIKNMAHGPQRDNEVRQVLTEIGTFLDANIGPAASVPAPAAVVPRP